VWQLFQLQYVPATLGLRQACLPVELCACSVTPLSDSCPSVTPLCNKNMKDHTSALMFHWWQNDIKWYTVIGIENHSVTFFCENKNQTWMMI
jgi:hypothetical protein